MLVKVKNTIQAPKPIPYELARRFAALSQEAKRHFIRTRCDDAKALTIKYTWAAWAREKQLWQLEAPWEWQTWLQLAGRGFGKTRGGAEWVIEQAWNDPSGHIALVGRTVADVRDVMVGGRSGILASSPPWFLPEYEPSKRRLTWPNGCLATTYTAEKPDQMRGPGHTKAWADERAAWQYDDAWDQLQFGLREGEKPQCVVTTTPRATKAIKDLAADPATHVTRGSTYENRVNLADKFIREIERRYAGTRLGRQEIEGKIIDDIEGALWKRDWIEAFRVVKHPELKRIVVAVDPPASSDLTSDSPAEAGIVVAGIGLDDHGYMLADYSCIGTPDEWASAAITAYNVFEADAIVGEVNNGGDMVEAVVQSIAREKKMKRVSFKAVRATRGKQLRAEPISSLYQRGQIHHVGTFPDTEDQQCSWVPGEKSPDRLDANVWAFTDLMVGAAPTGRDLLDDLKARKDARSETQKSTREKLREKVQEVYW